MTNQERALLQWIDKRQREIEGYLAELREQKGQIDNTQWIANQRYLSGKLAAFDNMESHVLGLMS